MTTRRVLLATAMLIVGAAPAFRAQTADLRAIYGFGPNDIWVVGNRPAAVHWDGHAWNEVPFTVSVPSQLNALWGSGPRDLFAVGDNGALLHYDGTLWSRQTAPTQGNLIAVGGRSASDVYALVDNFGENDAPTVLHYDGRAWSATQLTVPFHATGMVVTPSEVVVAGTANNEESGAVARLSGGRWTVSGWDGQRVTDPATGAAPWSAVSAGGGAVLLFAQRSDNTVTIAISSGAGWTLLPPAASVMSGMRVARAFLAGDATPVALFDAPGFARFTGGRWNAVSPMANMMQSMMQQQMAQPQPGAPGRPPAVPQPVPMTPQQMAMQQMAANPMMAALRLAGFSMSDARGTWGVSSADFYVTTGDGHVTHVVGDDAQIAYDASCSDPMMAQMSPICQMLQMMRQGQQNR